MGSETKAIGDEKQRGEEGVSAVAIGPTVSESPPRTIVGRNDMVSKGHICLSARPLNRTTAGRRDPLAARPTESSGPSRLMAGGRPTLLRQRFRVNASERRTSGPSARRIGEGAPLGEPGPTG